MSSNFIVVDHNFVNADSDATYAAESITTGGVGPGGIIPHGFLNKFMAQNSTGVAALMQALANQGYTCQDSNYAALVTTLQNALLTSAQVRTHAITVPYSPNPIFNAALNTKFEMTLTGAVTSPTVPGAQWGDILTFDFIVNPTGAYSVAPPPYFKGWGAPVSDSHSTTHNVQQFYVSYSTWVIALGPMSSWVV
jgi:hypothetical protein